MMKNEIEIKKAAEILNVSIGTIRNWIKTGYLSEIKKGTISSESFDKFISETAGKEKLNLRANKLLKDNYKNNNFIDVTKLDFDTIENEDISELYENSLSESYKNKEGIYYTPVLVVKDMFQGIEIKPEYKFLDPCCGTGNFIIEAIKKGISPENVYGFDVDENAVCITKQRIKKEFNFDSYNIQCKDFLSEARNLETQGIKFDLILTNPPWGKKINKKEKENYSNLYDCGKSYDSSSLFLSASLNILKENGILCFLLQEAFFNIASFEDIRKKISKKKIIKIVDYGNIFDKLLTKAQSIIIQNKNANHEDTIECNYQNKKYKRKLISFKNNPKCIFNFWANEEEAEIINRIYSVKHTKLKDKVKWGLGIVTGNNKKYCINYKKEGYIPIYKGSDITKSGIKEPNNFILSDFSKFQQVAPLEMYKAKEKIIYKFISSELCFFLDTEQRYVLNSVNFFIPEKLKINNKQLTDLLNSNIINWLFKKLFNTHKILRSDLELIPIHEDYFSNNDIFSENDYLDYLKLKEIITENFL